MKIVSKSLEVGGKTITLEVGRLAEQAEAAVLARIGDTMVWRQSLLPNPSSSWVISP